MSWFGSWFGSGSGEVVVVAIDGSRTMELDAPAQELDLAIATTEIDVASISVNLTTETSAPEIDL